MDQRSYERWLGRTHGIGLDAETLVISTPNAVSRAWIEERLMPPIAGTLAELGKPDLRLEFVVGTEESEDRKGSEPSSIRPLGAKPTDLGEELDGLYTFDGFVIAESNRLAYQAALHVASRPGEAYNPLFVVGGAGSGKTHLIQALGNAIAKGFPDYKVGYITGDRFINGLIKAIQEDAVDRFHWLYQDVDVLIVDDVQRVSGKERAQKELLHAFNELHNTDRQIVLASQLLPKALHPLEERLRSRFEWGLVVELKSPELQTRVAVLTRKAQLLDVEVPQDVIKYLGRHVTGNFRDLEDALRRVVSASHKRPLTIDDAAREMGLPVGSKRGSLTPGYIAHHVREHFRLPAGALSAGTREQSISMPRQIAMYLAREETSSTLEEIGEVLGGRDHSTVLHGWEKISHSMRYDPELRAHITAIRTKLYGNVSADVDKSA